MLREEGIDFTARENHLDSHPGVASRWKGSQGGILGGFPGILSPRGGSPCPHTPVTMTIQPQPPVAMTAAYPIRLVFFLFHPTSSKSLPVCMGRGSREGGLRVTRARGKTRIEGLAGGTVGGRSGVSGGEDWRSGKRKREIGWSGKTGEDFECNSRSIWARCSW